MLAIKLHRQDGKHPSIGTLKHCNEKMASLWETNWKLLEIVVNLEKNSRATLSLLFPPSPPFWTSCVHACVFSHVQLFGTPRTVAHPAPLCMGFYRQESAVGCHFLLQGIPLRSKRPYLDLSALPPQWTPKEKWTGPQGLNVESPQITTIPFKEKLTEEVSLC